MHREHASRPVWSIAFLLLVPVLRLSAQDPATAVDSTSIPQPERDVLLTSGAVSSYDSTVRRAAHPWSSTTFDRSLISGDPSRSLEGLLVLSPSITRVNNQPRTAWTAGPLFPDMRGLSASYSDLHVRGSREGESEYRFGGVPSTDRWSNTDAVPYLPEMIERVTVHTGAYGPDLGSMGGGVVDMELREGGEQLSFGASFHTDKFAKPGETLFNTSSYGWTTAVVTLGMPLPLDFRIFVAGEMSRKEDRSPMYLEPANMTLLPDYFAYNASSYLQPPGPFVVERNRVPGQSAERNVLQWNLTGQPAGFDVAFFGSVASGRRREVTWPTAVTNFFRSQRLPWAEETSALGALRIGRALGDRFSVRSTLAYSSRHSNTSDPDFGESWYLYVDSAANAAKGYGGFQNRYTGPKEISAIAAFRMMSPNGPNNSYRKESATTWIWSARAEAQLDEAWSASVQAEAEWWTLRRFSLGDIRGGMFFLDVDANGTFDRTFANDLDRRFELKGAWRIQNFGYDLDGNEADEGADLPRKPTMWSFSANTSWQEGTFKINAGLRAVRFSMDMPTVPRQYDPATGANDWRILDAIWDYSHEDFNPDVLRRSEVESYLLPRVSIQRATPDGRLYAAYGAFVEPASQHFLQIDDKQLSRLLNPFSRVPYNLGGPALTFTLQASHTKLYEVGIEQRILPAVEAHAVVYRKDLSRQVQMEHFRSGSGEAYVVGFGNFGESSITGFEAGMTVTPTTSLEIGLRYAWASMKGFGSYARSNQFYVTDEFYGVDDRSRAKVQRPLSYERTHRFVGTFGIEPAQGMFEGLRLMATVRLESGTPYTMNLPIRSLGGASTLWDVGVRSLKDVRVIAPIEPANSSRTPWTSTIDASASYEVRVGPTAVTLFVLVTNLLDSKNVVNVFPNSGSANDDTWLSSSFSGTYRAIPQYESFYRWLNLQNRWAHMNVTGYDIYGTPRQIQFGVKVGI